MRKSKNSDIASQESAALPRGLEALVRAAKFQDALAAAGPAAALLSVVALGLLAAFWSSDERFYVLGLAALCIIVAAAAFVAKRSLAVLAPRRVDRGLKASAAIAGLLGVAWSTMPVGLFPESDWNHKLIVLAADTIVISLVYRLVSMPFAGILYLAPICIGSFVGFALSSSSAATALAVGIPLFGVLLLVHANRFDSVATKGIIDRLRSNEQDQAIRDLLLDLDENTSDWLWSTDAEGRLSSAWYHAELGNAAPAAAFEGTSLQQIAGKSAASTAGWELVLSAFATRRPFRNQLVEIKGDSQSWWRLSGKPVFDAEGEFVGYRGVGSDMTGTKNSESRIAHLSNFDTLTGLANRVNFQLFAARQCASASKDGRLRALLSLDLDGFKTVNDSLGHEGGDELLKQVSGRLIATAPAETFIARVGGDEFVLWLGEATRAEGIAAALVEALSVPFNVQGLSVNIGASVGIALTPKHTVEPDDLLIKADLALYRAKASASEKICVFSPVFEDELIERRKLHNDLKLALARGEFTLNYQPLVDVALGRVVGFETLLRWVSPDRGPVSPADFIPAAEATGLINALSRWIFVEACKTAATWPHDVHVAINVSPPHVKSPEFLHDVTVALQTSGLHPSRLEIEVTEGVFLDKSPAALEALRTLRTRGVKIALDDFGTGYSSLNYLTDFPVDKIKIDRSFIEKLDAHANSAIVDAILGLARKLSIRVNAEGVETKEQAVSLKRRRCDEMQGYLLSRPRPAADVADMIATVPTIFRAAVPTYMDSPLASALVAKAGAA